MLYNTARIEPGTFGDYSQEDVVYDFKMPNLGIYVTATLLLPRPQRLAKRSSTAHPAIYITSGAIKHQPLGLVFSLIMAKAAQASLNRMSTEENEGVGHVALMTVGIVVSLEEKVNNPKNIAGKCLGLYSQGKGNWKVEMKCV